MEPVQDFFAMNLVVADKYEILRPLGHGGMAEVMLAKQRGVVGIDKLVVIKRVLPQYEAEKNFIAMFLDEARVAADLVHPNVVSVHEVGESDGNYYMVLEYLQGRDLRRLQRRLEKSVRPIPVGHVVRIALDAAEGLYYAHTKKDLDGQPLHIVHRDVSPQNIIVTWDGSAKILDFGIAKADSQKEHTETGIIKGKYTYMSPEQARGQKVTPSSDQFSLGVILWELLTGKRLFKREHDVAIVTAICEEDVLAPSKVSQDSARGLPPALDAIVLKMLAKEPENRFSSMREVTLALEDCVSSTSLSVSHARLGTYLEELFIEELERELRLNEISSQLLFDKTQSETMDVDQTVLDEKVRSTVMRAQRFPLRLDEDSTAPARSRMRPRLGFESEKEVKGTKGARALAPEKKGAVEGEKAESKKSARRIEQGKTAKESHFLTEDAPATLVLPRRVKSLPLPKVKKLDDALENVPRSRWPYLLWAGGAFLLFFVVGAGLIAFLNGPPVQGDVAIYSLPSGANIFLDGAMTGKVTPAMLHQVSYGEEHRLRLELNGFHGLEVKIKIPQKKADHRVDLQLKKLMPALIAPAGVDSPEL